MVHETRHSQLQWDKYGLEFGIMYLETEAAEDPCNIAEVQAGAAQGGYSNCHSADMKRKVRTGREFK